MPRRASRTLSAASTSERAGLSSQVQDSVASSTSSIPQGNATLAFTGPRTLRVVEKGSSPPAKQDSKGPIDGRRTHQPSRIPHWEYAEVEWTFQKAGPTEGWVVSRVRSPVFMSPTQSGIKPPLHLVHTPSNVSRLVRTRYDFRVAGEGLDFNNLIW
jgi:hypothetical protein